MNIQRLAVTGDALFLKRHGALVDALRASIPTVDIVETGNYFKVPPGIFEYIYYRLRYRYLGGDRWHDLMLKSPHAFTQRSRQAARIVDALPNRPDHILHFHSMYTPSVPSQGGVGFSVFVDYTAAQCARNWEPWSPHLTPQDTQAWIDCQRPAFADATRIFAFSEVTRASIRDDYKIPEEKVKVVGNAGDSVEIPKEHKPFGSKQLLINGSDWLRKGVDIALDAIKIVRKQIPAAKLVIIGCEPREPQSGVEYAGIIRDRDRVRQLFMDTDIVLSPARCDPFPTFCIEGMSYGVPVIVSDRDGMPEIVDYGSCGSIAALDGESVAREVVTLLQDENLLRTKSEAAKERVRTTFNWNRIAQIMIESWKQVEEKR